MKVFVLTLVLALNIFTVNARADELVYLCNANSNPEIYFYGDSQKIRIEIYGNFLTIDNYASYTYLEKSRRDRGFYLSMLRTDNRLQTRDLEVNFDNSIFEGERSGQITVINTKSNMRLTYDCERN